MLEVQKYLSNHTLQNLTDEFGIKVKEYYDRVVLNYDQIDSPKFHPIIRECRALILSYNIKDNYKVLCRAFDRFFNLNENPNEKKFDISTATLWEKIDGCFPFETTLKLWEGGTIRIGEIVTKKLSVTLIGRDENGNLVPSIVTDWHNNGHKDYWIDLYTTASPSSRKSSKKLIYKLRTTPNHSIFVNGKETLACDIKVGGKLISSCFELDDIGIKMIKDSLLGDGCIVKNGNNANYQESHKKDHFGYVNYLRKTLGQCRCNRSDTISVGTNLMWIGSRTYPSLSNLRKEWYPEEKKIIPKDISWIDDFSIAKWYMDDGSLTHTEYQQDRACFATNGFCQEDVQRLANKLEEMYGVSCVVYFSKGWCIRINSGKSYVENKRTTWPIYTIEFFWKRISKYIHDDFLYKLPERWRNRTFEGYPIAKEIHAFFEAEVIKVENIKFTSERFQHGSVGFDITTSTNNYMAKGILVHNSIMPVFHDGEKWQVSTRGTAFAEGMSNCGKSYRDIFFEALGSDQLDYAFANIPKEYTVIFEMVSPETRVVKPYPESKIYLIGIRNKKTGEELPILIANEWACVPGVKWFYPKHYNFSSYDEVLKSIKELPTLDEGYVVVFPGYHRIKIKNPSYLAIANLRMNGVPSDKRIAWLVWHNDYDEYLSYFPEDQTLFNPWIESRKKLVEDINANLHHMNIKVQKDFALTIQNYRCKSILFAMRKGDSLQKIFDRMSENSILNLLEVYKNGANS